MCAVRVNVCVRVCACVCAVDVNVYYTCECVHVQVCTSAWVCVVYVCVRAGMIFQYIDILQYSLSRYGIDTVRLSIYMQRSRFR